MIDISVVIPTFRRPALLLEAIESVRNQQVPVEIIVVDDSPEASAREVIQQHSLPHITYVHNESPSGGRPAAVRNYGSRLARGRFVHFLDDDDKVAPGYYRDALDCFARHPNRGVVFGRIEPFAGDPRASMDQERAFFAAATRRSRLAARIASRRWMTANLLFVPTLLVNSACIIRRECIEAIGGYDTAIGLCEDVDFFCRAIRRFGFAFLDRVAIHYRIGSGSLMHGRSDDAELHASYQRMYSRYRETNSAVEFFMMKLCARTMLRIL